jgi:hypothetical protein
VVCKFFSETCDSFIKVFFFFGRLFGRMCSNNMATVRPFSLVSRFIALNNCRSYDCVFVIEAGREHAYLIVWGICARHGDDARLLAVSQMQLHRVCT